MGSQVRLLSLGVDRLQPVGELVAVAVGEDLGERAHVFGEGVQVWAGSQCGGEAGPVALGEVVGVPQDPATDHARFRCGCRDWAEVAELGGEVSQRLEVGAD